MKLKQPLVIRNRFTVVAVDIILLADHVFLSAVDTGPLVTAGIRKGKDKTSPG